MNVRTPSGAELGGTLDREFIRAEIKKNGWLYWYWKPAQRKDGYIDHGYSGIAPSHEDFAEMKARLCV